MAPVGYCLLAVVVLTVIGPLAAGCTAISGDDDSDEEGISIRDVWSRPVLLPESDGPATGVVYMIIENSGNEADRLIEASSPASRATEIHRSQIEDGVMRMQQTEQIEIPAGETVRFEPGGYHVMLIDLQRDLETGDEIEVDLEFERAGEMTVRSEVRQP